MNIHKAIRELYTNVVSINGDHDAYDEQGVLVDVDDDAVAAKVIELNVVSKLKELRVVRTGKLRETDWWGVSDNVPMSTEQTTYRQALRDITATYSSIEDVVWPTKP